MFNLLDEIKTSEIIEISALKKETTTDIEIFKVRVLYISNFILC